VIALALVFAALVGAVLGLIVYELVSSVARDARTAHEPVPFPDEVDRKIRRAGVKACRDCEDTR
jgi:hypothetical protein